MATSTEPVDEPTHVAGLDRRRRPLAQVVADLSVAHKLAFGFGAVAMVALTLVAAIFFTVAELEHTIETGQNRAAERHNATGDVRFSAAVMRGAQLAYVASEGADRPAFDAGTRQFEQALEELHAVAVSDHDAALFTKINTGYQTFLITDQLIWLAVQEGDLDLARNLALGPEGLAFGFMAEDADLLAAQARADETAGVDTFAATTGRTRRVALVLGVAALLMVAVASWYITHLIRDPLDRVRRAAEQAAAGDISVRADVSADDETGRVASAFNSMLAVLRARETSLRAEYERQGFSRTVATALELAMSEDDVHEAVRRSLEELVPDRPSELLLTDGTGARLTPVIAAGPGPDGPGCSVPSPNSCPAVRRGTSTRYDSSEALDACPYLRDRRDGPCSAVCVPLSFMGRSVGVLHSTGLDGERLDDDLEDSIVGLGSAAGSRIGMLRSMAETELHATTDGLTGLINRRTFETRARAMHRRGEPFSLVMADLDRFKMLNDTHGHEAGDRALRIFAEMLTSSVRGDDLVCRWGGEEFTLALIGAGLDRTRDTLERIRTDLLGRLASSGSVPFTASYGYVDTRTCVSLEEAIRLADSALYEAKNEGRDRAVAATTPAQPATGETEPAADSGGTGDAVSKPVESRF